MKTPELVAGAARLRAEGLTAREIGERLGVSRSTAEAWLSDPDGARARARKASYAATCVDCGTLTSGSEGRREEPRCHPCAAVLSGDERRIWTKPAIVCAIQEWAFEHGEPPGMADWNPTSARLLNDEERAARFERDGCWPWSPQAAHVCGSWNAAIEAAGFEPRVAHGGGGNEQRRRRARQAS